MHTRQSTRATNGDVDQRYLKAVQLFYPDMTMEDIEFLDRLWERVSS